MNYLYIALLILSAALIFIAACMEIGYWNRIKRQNLELINAILKDYCRKNDVDVSGIHHKIK